MHAEIGPHIYPEELKSILITVSIKHDIPGHHFKKFMYKLTMVNTCESSKRKTKSVIPLFLFNIKNKGFTDFNAVNWNICI